MGNSHRRENGDEIFFHPESLNLITLSSNHSWRSTNHRRLYQLQNFQFLQSTPADYYEKFITITFWQSSQQTAQRLWQRHSKLFSNKRRKRKDYDTSFFSSSSSDYNPFASQTVPMLSPVHHWCKIEHRREYPGWGEAFDILTHTDVVFEKAEIIQSHSSLSFFKSQTSNRLMFNQSNNDLRVPTTRDQQTSRSIFRYIRSISTRNSLTCEGIGFKSDEKTSRPGRERSGRSSTPSGQVWHLKYRLKSSGHEPVSQPGVYNVKYSANVIIKLVHITTNVTNTLEISTNLILMLRYEA